MLNFEECNDYESETVCASEEEIATYWATKRPIMFILMIVKQVDLTDFDNPMQTYIKLAYVNPFPGSDLTTTVYFEPNTFLSFEDQIGFIPFLPSPDPVTFFSAERPVTIINERKKKTPCPEPLSDLNSVTRSTLTQEGTTL